ncbi:MAG: hypothetical protein R6U57_01930 [Anaerolineales bacterium]
MRQPHTYSTGKVQKNYTTTRVECTAGEAASPPHIPLPLKRGSPLREILWICSSILYAALTLKLRFREGFVQNRSQKRLDYTKEWAAAKTRSYHRTPGPPPKNMNSGSAIPLKKKALFWTILAALSTFFAEVWSGSEMFPFFKPWGMLVVVPLYGLHLLFLAWIVVRITKPSFPALLYAGMIFGLYEAYLTKVLWDPPWGEAWIAAGVAPIETLVLVFWWHAWFSFILPLLAGEQILTGSTSLLSCFPPTLARFFSDWKGFTLLALFGGTFQSVNSPSPGHSLLSGLSTTGVLIALILLWRKTTQGDVFTFEALLPNQKEIKWLAAPLGLMYLGLGLVLRPESFPDLTGHLVIWVSYALLAALLYLTYTRTPVLSPPYNSHTIEPLSPKTWLRLSPVFPIAATTAEILLPPLGQAIALISWAAGILFGIIMFIIAVKEIFTSKGSPHHEQS